MTDDEVERDEDLRRRIIKAQMDAARKEGEYLRSARRADLAAAVVILVVVVAAVAAVWIVAERMMGPSL